MYNTLERSTHSAGQNTDPPIWELVKRKKNAM